MEYGVSGVGSPTLCALVRAEILKCVFSSVIPSQRAEQIKNYSFDLRCSLPAGRVWIGRPSMCEQVEFRRQIYDYSPR